MAATNEAIEHRVKALGAEISEHMRGAVPGVFNKDFWASRLLDVAMDDPEIKVDLFRLIDVLPSLTTSDQIQTHLQEYILKEGRTLPRGLGAALKLSAGGLTGKLAATTLKRGVTEMAHRFIVGKDPHAALPALKKLHAEGLAFTMDLLGEATLSDPEADDYARRYQELIATLPKEATSWEADTHIDEGHHGPLPRANVSIKITALEPHLDAADPNGSIKRALHRVTPIVEAAQANNVFINFDLEQRAYHEIVYGVVEELCADPALKIGPHLGVVVQAYCRTAPDDLTRILKLAQKRGAPITVRLVKGAYWDYEVIHADQSALPSPVFLQKWETDQHYEHLSQFLIEHHEDLPPAFASHNLRSVLHAIALAEEADVPQTAYEFQTLTGMAEPMRQALRARGHRVRVYCPVGELLPGMAYLVRRLLENTANESFLRQSYHEKTEIGKLLKPPAPSPPSPNTDSIHADTATEFEHCPLMDFADAQVQHAFAQAVREAPSNFPVEVPFVVNGDPRRKGEPAERRSPSDDELLVAKVYQATRDDAREAVEAAAKAWPAWRDRPLEERVALLTTLADRLEEDRLSLAALQVYEVGKPWREADGDVAEAIDFCRYYAARAPIELGPQRQGHALGEINTLWYEGRGPAVVIAPWNFPLAILCGMTTAALVAGNTVIIKPSGQSCAVGYALYEHMRAAGFPGDVVQFLPGAGVDIGAYIVDSSQIAQIAFTGSRTVGLSIRERAAHRHPGQKQVKRMVCEMGGKNAVLVDEDADLDEAVAAVRQSAFGYAGQKCSACSRVLVVGNAYEPFLARLREATRSLTVCAAQLPECQIPPVVDQSAHERLMAIIEDPGEGAELLYRGEAPQGGWFVPPTLFRVDDPTHPLMQQELFGPVLAIMPVDTFEHGLYVALDSEFALTGGVFSRQPSHLEQARRTFRVGNLYLNRGCTGAIVGRQPFGGFNMSGIGTKAGGPGYLQHFADPRCVTENTMRRGFSPEVSI